MQLAPWLTTWWNSGSISYWLSHFVACLLTGCVVNACIRTPFAARLAPFGSQSSSLLVACRLNMPFPIGNRTLSQLRSLARCEPSTSISGGFRGFRLYLAVNVKEGGALGRYIALSRSSHTRENICACAVLTRLIVLPASHSRSQFIAHRVLLNWRLQPGEATPVDSCRTFPHGFCAGISAFWHYERT